MNKKGVRYQVLGVRKIPFLHLFVFLFILHPSSLILAHTRLYACSIGSDAPGASMGGSSFGAGLWQSDDTGKTWKQLGWKHVKCYSVDVVNKSNGKIIYEACGNGVLKSTDGGINWKMLTDWRITEVMDIAIDQKAPKNIYIATPGAIWKSDDGGDSWYEADTDIPYPIFVSRIKVDPKDHLTVYSATESGTYKSTGGGLQWTKFNASDLLGVLWSSNPRSPKNIHSTVTIGSNQFFGSLDGGVLRCANVDDYSFPVKIGLDSLQIWRLKAVEIK